jgi:hypothetical protein
MSANREAITSLIDFFPSLSSLFTHGGHVEEQKINIMGWQRWI